MVFKASYANTTVNRMVLAFTFATIAMLVAPSLQAQQAKLKIGIVELNQALNSSSSGKRSKNILMAAKSQKESELKERGAELKKLEEEIATNIMLSSQAKAKKRAELREQQLQLRTAVQQAQRILQDQERKLTESVISELSTIVEIIAKEEKFDFVFEKSIGQILLYSRVNFIDITKKVIERYDNLQDSK